MSNNTELSLAAELEQFTGTTAYYRLSARVLLTDGTKFLADRAMCWWLMTVIDSHLPQVPEDEHFCIACLTVESNGASNFELVSDIPNGRVYGKQRIPYTDFPLEAIKLYCARQEDYFVVMLPSEY